eukprot:TRINITY_DN66941_c2_g1_i1.p1 TRINITY_DN66941_c2_g1~~TRINITY_DN66941_c2_g1_i1.p1  ORF type:complete len:167 (-),score=4.89 TRINITY_DN66941_c2_g1_i1:150-650(-)
MLTGLLVLCGVAYVLSQPPVTGVQWYPQVDCGGVQKPVFEGTHICYNEGGTHNGKNFLSYMAVGYVGPGEDSYIRTRLYSNKSCVSTVVGKFHCRVDNCCKPPHGFKVNNVTILSYRAIIGLPCNRKGGEECLWPCSCTEGCCCKFSGAQFPICTPACERAGGKCT